MNNTMPLYIPQLPQWFLWTRVLNDALKNFRVLTHVKLINMHKHIASYGEDLYVWDWVLFSIKKIAPKDRDIDVTDWFDSTSDWAQEEYILNSFVDLFICYVQSVAYPNLESMSDYVCMTCIFWCK